MRCSVVVCLNILIFSVFVWSHAIEASRWDLSKEEDMELERQLKILNKPYVKSFKDNYGNTYDCVDIYEQPAFDHPLLKNHTIQMKPSSFMKNKINKSSKKDKLYNFGFKKGCPAGTVLIRRTRKEDLIRAKKFAQYLQPHLQYDGKYGDSENENHYAAIVIDSRSNTKYYGASASFEVHQLSNVSVNQATGAQVILLKGEHGPKHYINAIHFGWNIFYQKNLDNLTHFFTYWTTDGYNLSRCLNMLCPGYVQVSNGTTPGMIIPEGEMELSVSRDRSTGNWLLRFVDNDNELLGYWPKELFNNMADSSQVQVIGVTNSPKDELSPPMGNGIRPSIFFSKAAKFRRIKLMNGNGDFFPPSSEKVITLVDLPYFYYALDHLQDHGGTWGYGFDYGGPGGWSQENPNGAI